MCLDSFNLNLAFFLISFLSVPAFAISDGIKVTPGSFLDSAVAIQTSEGSICSGLLVSPTLVLTAGHCTDQKHTPYRALNGTDVDRRKKRGSQAKVLSYKSHPEYKELGSDTTDRVQFFRNVRNDFGYVILETPLADVKPAAIKIFSKKEEISSVLFQDATLCGYGASEYVPDGKYSPFDLGAKRYGTKSIDQALPGIAVFNGLSQAPLPGDSGGPAFLNTIGTEPLAIGLIQSFLQDQVTLEYKQALISLFTPSKICWAIETSGVPIASYKCDSGYLEQ